MMITNWTGTENNVSDGDSMGAFFITRIAIMA